TWTTYTSSVARLDAATAYSLNNNYISQFGGHDLQGNEYDTVQDIYSAGVLFPPRGMPYTMSRARAWTQQETATIYVAGGSTSDFNARHLASGSQGWFSMRADAPVDLNPIVGMGDYLGTIWATTPTHLYFFDPPSVSFLPGRWRPVGLPAPAGFITAVTS